MTTTTGGRPLAVVTGASSAIGQQLAHRCARDRFDLVAVADTPGLEEVAELCRGEGAEVEAIYADLANPEDIDRLCTAIGERAVAVLVVNAGRCLGGAFLDQSIGEMQYVIDANITGTLDLVQRIGRRMVADGGGRILLTGSIAGVAPERPQAVYDGTRAYIDSFAYALRRELAATGVTVTCLVPRAPRGEFAVRSGAEDEDDPAQAAEVGFDAMMRGEKQIVAGVKNKIQAAFFGAVYSPLAPQPEEEEQRS